MTIPVLFLDDASRHVGSIEREPAMLTAMTLIASLKSLLKANSRIALNTRCPISQCQISDNWTLQAVFGGSSRREEWDFLKGLSNRAPYSAELENGLQHEIDLMEFRTHPGGILSTAAAWAAILESATVALDAHTDWSREWLELGFYKLQDDGGSQEASDRVRNVSQSAHVEVHIEWLKRLGLSSTPTAAQVWRERDQRFPNLRFLPRVERQLDTLDGTGAPFSQALSALEALENDAANWPKGSNMPEYSRKATREAEQRRRLCRVHDDFSGQLEDFDWHTRFTGNIPGRVHFRVDATNRLIFVAYIGGKLFQSM